MGISSCLDSLISVGCPMSLPFSSSASPLEAYISARASCICLRMASSSVLPPSYVRTVLESNSITPRRN